MKNGESSLKKVDYSIMSDKKCPICRKPIKKNVADRVKGNPKCYVCFKLSKGKKNTDVHRIVGDKKVFIKTIDFIKLQKENKKKYLKR